MIEHLPPLPPKKETPILVFKMEFLDSLNTSWQSINRIPADRSIRDVYRGAGGSEGALGMAAHVLVEVADSLAGLGSTDEAINSGTRRFCKAREGGITIPQMRHSNGRSVECVYMCWWRLWRKLNTYSEAKKVTRRSGYLSRETPSESNSTVSVRNFIEMVPSSNLAQLEKILR